MKKRKAAGAKAKDEQTALLKKMRDAITPELMERIRLIDEIVGPMTHRKPPPRLISKFTHARNA